MKLFRPICVALAFLSSLSLIAAEKKEEPKEEKKEEISVTTNSVTIAGNKIEYIARAGTILLKEDSGKERASFFFISYTRTGVEKTEKRPITFSFNGGPGSSSIWLHMGVLGPRRAPLNEDGTLPPPPYGPIPNEFSILDETDLVFIDPVGTGFSRAIPVDDARKFHGVTEDVQSVGDFIRLYVTRFERWASPKFLIGESYGTTRAAVLSDHLQDRHGMYLNGVMLVSTVLDFETIRFGEGNDTPYIMFLPTYTATAWHHKKLAPDLQGDLQAALAEAEAFAQGPYNEALLRSSSLTTEQRNEIARKVARLTGLSAEFVSRSNLRVAASHFFKELLRDERLNVGRFDSRYKGKENSAVESTPEFDPSYFAVYGPFAGAFNHYVRSELNYKSDLPYEVLNGLSGVWNYGDRFKGRYLNVTEYLRNAMTKNPHLRVYVANGIFDLATPYLAAKYTMKELDYSGELQKRVTIIDYPAGHMMYVHRPSLEKQKADIAEFIRSALQR